jgi:cell division septum initiation protein DivIVA
MLRHEVNRLQQENNTLHESVNELETKVTAYVIVVLQRSVRRLTCIAKLTVFFFLERLKESEEKLTAITAEQGTNVDQLVGLVKENQEILDEMKASCCVKITFQQQCTVSLSPLACCL